ncbi:MAG: histidine kinase dimerization/phospho-acceptor domain-containing protein [Owenweeksia sp.]|nr:histidine kinase dimerization/phospho-acceptor domain-containing protein [Owenweeksia sp.]
MGQLTAGIAHEINNPINFVSSNIKPLSRDLDDLYEIVDHYKLVEGQELEAKLQKAHALRQELDYDFVKEEIRDLVQGISDGAHRTSEIVKGLRTFSRLDEDVIKLASLEEGITSTLVLLRSKINGNVEVVRGLRHSGK